MWNDARFSGNRAHDLNAGDRMMIHESGSRLLCSIADPFVGNALVPDKRVNPQYLEDLE